MAPSVNEQYIVDEKGKPTAVILPIKDYEKMLSILEEVEGQRETRILSKSPEFKKLGVESRMKATSHALKQGWLTIDDLE